MPKTIFGTTEKSNFILNMKTETYHKWNLWILLSFLILMPVMSVPLEFARVYSLPDVEGTVLRLYPTAILAGIEAAAEARAAQAAAETTAADERD
ncbi:MAG: hypothetical protein IJ236_07110, partial [Oscillospiraceae bacterium]|nr:hypothetical protein [Oscillospiraceae bacterium]